MGETVKRWKLVEADDGEFTARDLLFIWAMMHVFVVNECGFPASNEIILKLTPIMENVYKGLQD